MFNKACGTASVHGRRKILRKDLNPTLNAIHPGIGDPDVVALCELAEVPSRTHAPRARVHARICTTFARTSKHAQARTRTHPGRHQPVM